MKYIKLVLILLFFTTTVYAQQLDIKINPKYKGIEERIEKTLGDDYYLRTRYYNANAELVGIMFKDSIRGSKEFAMLYIENNLKDYTKASRKEHKIVNDIEFYIYYESDSGIEFYNMVKIIPVNNTKDQFDVIYKYIGGNIIISKP